MGSYRTHHFAIHYSLPSISQPFLQLNSDSSNTCVVFPIIEYTRCALSIFFTVTDNGAFLCTGLPKLESWVKGHIHF